jgi:hypothetical protein
MSTEVSDWLKQSAVNLDGDEEQRELHDAASRCLGTLAGRNGRRAETARQAIRDRLRRRYAR